MSFFSTFIAPEVPNGLTGRDPDRNKTLDILVFLFGVIVALGLLYFFGKYIINSF